MSNVAVFGKYIDIVHYEFDYDVGSFFWMSILSIDFADDHNFVLRTTLIIMKNGDVEK